MAIIYLTNLDIFAEVGRRDRPARITTLVLPANLRKCRQLATAYFLCAFPLRVSTIPYISSFLSSWPLKKIRKIKDLSIFYVASIMLTLIGIEIKFDLCFAA